MCLYVTIQLNKRYLPTKKNKGIIPQMKDERMKYIPAKCGKCAECRKEKANMWRVRLSEELRHNFGYFMTLTFSNDGFKDLCENLGLPLNSNENTVATIGIRRFLERVRKHTGKSIKHWFVTELGEEKDRLHLHGVLFNQKAVEYCRKYWKYGHVFVGSYCNERTINYITKYMLKYDVKHKHYTQIVLASKGIGNQYFERLDAQIERENALTRKGYVPVYRFRNRTKMAMPKYYKDKLFTDEEREQIWMGILDEGRTYVHGEKCWMHEEELINSLREYYRNRMCQIMGDDPNIWSEQKKQRAREKWRKYLQTSPEKRTRCDFKAVKESAAKIAELEVGIYEAMREREKEENLLWSKDYCPF